MHRGNDYGFNADEQRNRTYTGMGFDINVHDQWAVESQGPIHDRTREYLGTSDRIIVAYRRVLLKAIEQAMRRRAAADGARRGGGDARARAGDDRRHRAGGRLAAVLARATTARGGGARPGRPHSPTRSRADRRDDASSTASASGPMPSARRRACSPPSSPAAASR